jgi:60 kDa SS-A/Ro ribonucleoprotein
MSDFTILSDVMSSQITGQMKPIEGKESLMNINHAGGYSFTVSDVDYILRCLILGTNKNTYYATSREMSQECIEFIKKMILDNKGSLLVDTISSVYEEGRAPKQDFTLMALAIASSCEDLETRKKAYKVVSKLRTFSHIYTWKGYHKVASKSKGMGKLSKLALCTLFENMTPTQLSYQVTKYPHRKTAVEDWSFIDLLRCIHLKGDKLPLEGQYVLKHVVKGKDDAIQFLDSHPEIKESHVIKYMNAVEKVKSLTDTETDKIELIDTIYEYNLPREVVPTWGFKYPEVWRAILLNKDQTKVTMPMTALIRNLGVMTSKGVFDDSVTLSLVTEHLKTDTVIKKARLHPVNILIAMFTYQTGHGEKGKLVWTPNEKIVSSLENAFYKSFKYVEPTGKRILHGIDCSGSMTSKIPCLQQISAHQAASVLAMTFAKIESESPQRFVGFTANPYKSGNYIDYSDRNGLTELNITPNMNLDEVCKATQLRNFGSTDCSLPIEEAINDFKSSGGTKGLYDVFMIYTDNETYAGKRHPCESLKEYRELTKIPAKMVVIACMPNAYSIADPTDGGMLDVVGFDTNAPEIVMNFIRGDSLDNGLVAGPVIAEDQEEE